MNKLNTTGTIALVLGIIAAILGWSGFPDSLGAGYTTMIGFFLIIIGVIIFIVSWMKNKN